MYKIESLTLTDLKKEHRMKVVKGFLPLAAGFFMSCFPLLYGQGHRIEITVEGLSNDTLILGEYFTTRMIPVDTLVLDRHGKGVFEGPDPFEGGLYLVYFDPNHYFDFILGDDQVLSIRADTADLAGSLQFEGSEDNRIFQEYKEYLEQKRSDLEARQALLDSTTDAAESARIREAQKKINRDMESFMDRIESEHPDLFVSDFIGATREPFPPEELLNGSRRHDDSIRYFYYKQHFLDRFDPFDIRLLHTPVYENKINNYISRAVTQHTDSLIAAVDFLLGGARGKEDLYRYLLITLFNHFADSKYMGMEVVYFHIAENYYIPDATWSSPDFISKLKENLERNKPTLIGEIAPNLILRRIPPEHFQMAAQDTAIKRDPHIGEDFFLHDIDARYTILYFWEADCGHCKTITPALYEVYSRLKDRGVEVVAVHVINSIEGKEKWIDFVNEHGLYDWINCWSPYSNEFRRLYNLQAYPQLYLLDRDKKIIGKRISPEQAELIINNIEKYGS
jgi:thiol-disulfide isomerase/thioredoxin